MLHFLVIGCGSIGKRHIKNLLLLGQQVFVYDRDLVKLESVVNEFGLPVYDFKSHHRPIDAFVICVPPIYHVPFTREALEHNSHIFIEKPISHNLNGVDEVITLAKKQGLVIQVGYQLRFNSGLEWIKKFLGRIGKVLTVRAEFGQWLPDWHPEEDYRKLYTCYEDQGGGIILDGSHEIDYLRWLIGEIKQVSCFSGKLSNLEIDTEDTAVINLKFVNGVIGNIHLDMLQRPYSRTCKIVGEKGQVFWNYLGRVRVFSEGQETAPEITYTDPYLEEMRSFVECIEKGLEPRVTAEDAKKTLQVALAAKKSSLEGKMQEVKE